jgi:hypothetical protein
MNRNVYSRKKDLVARKIAGEMVVVPIRGRLADMEKIYALNEVAEFVWERLDGSRGLEQIAGDMAECFDVAPDVALADAQEMVCEMISEGLLEPA